MEELGFTLELRQNFAEKLGCFRRTEINRAFVIHQLIVKRDRSCAASIEEWLIPSYENNETVPYDIWNDFIKFKQCLYCQKSCETSIFKPYCTQCYSYVKEGCVAMDLKQISPEMQTILKNKLAWLKSIPNISKINSGCHFCNKKHKSDSLPNAIWWFGDMKRLCWECFDKKLEEDKIYNIDFEK